MSGEGGGEGGAGPGQPEPPRDGGPPGSRLYRALLRLLPAWFRDEYGARLEATYRMQAGEERYRGGAGRLRLWWETVPDLARTAIRLRIRRERPGGGTSDDEEGRMGAWIYDVRSAWRALRGSPAFTATAVLTLALAIGANAALFGVVRGVILEPLPYGDPGSLAMVWSQWVNFPKTWVSEGEYRHYVQRNRTFDGLAAFSQGAATFTDPERPERVRAAQVTPNLFEVLGVQPALGRGFTEEEGRTEAPVAVLGHGTWSRRFQSDPAVVGGTVELDGESVEIVGVMPPGFALPLDFRGVEDTEVLRPLEADVTSPEPVPAYGGGHGWHVVGRVREGVTVEQAGRDLGRLVEGLEAEGVYPPEWRFRVQVFPLTEDVLGAAGPALRVLLGGVLLVLLVACANVANLLLARTRSRTREMGLRAAVGAGRGRLVRQLLLESLGVALMGGVLGTAAAAASLQPLLGLAPESIPRAETVRVDVVVLLYSLGITLATAVLFGLLPALRASEADLHGLLREGARDTGGRPAQRTQGLLVGVQTALAAALLVGAGLTVASYRNLAAIDPGFDESGALTLRLSLPGVRYDSMPAIHGFYESVLTEVRALPGVQEAGASRNLPLADDIGDSGIFVEGYEASSGEPPSADWQVVTAGYLEAMGIPVVRGRGFDAGDEPTMDQLVVNEAFVDRYLAGREPLGARVGAMSDTTVVIGVAGNVTHNGLTADVKPKFYRLQSQVPPNWRGATRAMTLVVRTSPDPWTVLEPVRRIVTRHDPSLAVSQVQTLDQVVRRTLGQPRFTATLLAIFAGVAVVLALVGVHGVLAYTVSRRTREIGVRMAVGASRQGVVRRVAGRGLVPALLGLGVGLGAAALGAELLEGLLEGVGPRDPRVFGGTALIFLLISVLASWLPARRAARVDPVKALRSE